eukprot:GHRR01005922.1.p1 GENE.GHRR01005922.1~~GHRR01005922.1.p1  ORF type:complete len:167 (+),score=76.77 GHRR01005922.1:426-926(+)
MGELVPVAGTSGALLAVDPEKTAAERERRIKEAQVLEAKLTEINKADTRIYNVSGSTAGAGSGDFHYYRQIRRAEQDRLRTMDADHRAKLEREQFEAKRRQAQTELDAKTAKKRVKRLKKKSKKKQKIAGGAADGADNTQESDNDSDAQQEGETAAAAVAEQQDLD